MNEKWIRNSPGGFPDNSFNVGGNGNELEVRILDAELNLNSRFRKLFESLTGKEMVLDLGSGLGSGFIRFLRKHKKIGRGKLVSLDLDRRNLQFQKNTSAKKILLVQADAAQIPLASKTVDILCQSCIKLDNPETERKGTTIAAEVERVLKPGALLVLDEPDDDPDSYPDPKKFDKLFEISGMTFYRMKNDSS